jgi:hypothetical protein
MARNEEPDTRQALLTLLLQKIKEDTYPSTTMLDLVEFLVTPEDIPSYVGVLMEKIQDETYPSISMIDRAIRITAP